MTERRGAKWRKLLGLLAILLGLLVGSLPAGGEPGPEPDLDQVLGVGEAIAWQIGSEQLKVLNAWREEILAAPDGAALGAVLGQVRLQQALAPLLQQNWDPDLTRFALRLLMRGDPGSLREELATTRAQYETSMPQFASATVTPGLVLRMLVDVDKKLAADTELTEANFSNKLLSKFVSTIFGNPQYKPIYDAIEARLNTYGLTIFDVAGNLSLLSQLPEYQMVVLAGQVFSGNVNLAGNTPVAPLVGGTVILEGRASLAGAEISLPGTAFKATTDQSGTFLLAELPQGEQVLRVTRNKFLAMESRVVVSQGKYYLPGVVKLGAGDVNGDGSIDIMDLRAVAGRFDGTGGANNFDLQFDLDDDRRIGLLDIALLARNLSR